MKYSEILKLIAIKENVSPKEIEKEMKKALTLAGVDCTTKDFVEKTSNSIKKTIYRKIV